MEMDIAQELVNDIVPENMDNAKIDEAPKPFDDYILPSGGYSF